MLLLWLSMPKIIQFHQRLRHTDSYLSFAFTSLLTSPKFYQVMWYNSTRKHHNNLTRNVRNRPFYPRCCCVFFSLSCILLSAMCFTVSCPWIVRNFMSKMIWIASPIPNQIESSACLPVCLNDIRHDNLNSVSKISRARDKVQISAYAVFFLLFSISLSGFSIFHKINFATRNKKKKKK